MLREIVVEEEMPGDLEGVQRTREAMGAVFSRETT